jgi:hypothetical protein
MSARFLNAMPSRFLSKQRQGEHFSQRNKYDLQRSDAQRVPEGLELVTERLDSDYQTDNICASAAALQLLRNSDLN